MRRRQAATMARQSYLEGSYEMANLTGDGTVVAQPMTTNSGLKDFQTTDVRKLPSRKLMGLGVEYGRYGQYFGVMLVGATYYRNTETWTMGVKGISDQPTEGESAWVTQVRGHENGLDAQVQMMSLRALQPQLRYVLGPVSFAIQAGVEVRGLLVKEKNRTADAPFDDGFYAVDLHASGQATARIFVYEGLYASVAYQHGISLLKNIAGASNLRGGVGYAF
jgi:hypothetical protein